MIFWTTELFENWSFGQLKFLKTDLLIFWTNWSFWKLIFWSTELNFKCKVQLSSSHLIIKVLKGSKTEQVCNAWTHAWYCITIFRLENQSWTWQNYKQWNIKCRKIIRKKKSMVNNNLKASTKITLLLLFVLKAMHQTHNSKSPFFVQKFL